MLTYVYNLHEKSVNAPKEPFSLPWEEIGPGYCYGPAFGHWDIIHACLDQIAFKKDHVKMQLENVFSLQQENGKFPSITWMKEGAPNDWNNDATHPPVWVFAADDYYSLYGDKDFLKICFEKLVKQIKWFEENRKAEENGFYYTDILNNVWESGVDEGIRFLEMKIGKFACVDATAHVYNLYTHAIKWGEILEINTETSTKNQNKAFAEKASMLLDFIQHHLYDEETECFHDIWSVHNKDHRPITFEGIWPLVVSAATPAQAKKVIYNTFLNPVHFFAKHPITTVSMEEPAYELRMWRGPSWNSMSYWTAKACMNYGFYEGAIKILEAALDDSAEIFEQTNTIWEFYNPTGGSPLDVKRKPHTEFNTPCKDYLGHNPLIAMAVLYDLAKKLMKAD